MNVLLTGATGFVGRAVTDALTPHGHAVVALGRHAPERKAGTVSWRAANIRDEASIRDAMRGTEAVIHLVGIISEAPGATFRQVHVDGTRNVVSAAIALGIKRYVHMSALGTRPDAASRYHQTKYEAEQIVRHSGLDWTIFRPSLIYGPEDHFTNMFARMSRFSPFLPVMGAGEAPFAPVHIQVVAEAFAGALDTPAAIGKTFDLCGPERVTMPELMRRILRACGRRRAIVHVPMPIARAQARLLEFVYAKILRSAPPLNRDQLVMLEEGNVGDPGPADTMFDLKHPPLEFRQD